MSCGTPVVAHAVGGVPEVLTDPEVGTLVMDMTAIALAAAIDRILGNLPDRSWTEAACSGMDWAQTSLGQVELFADAVRRVHRTKQCGGRP